MNFNKKDAVADAVDSVLQQEEDSLGVKPSVKPKTELDAKLIDKVEGPTPTDTPARKSIKSHAAAIVQPKVGVVRKESVTLKGFKSKHEQHSIFEQMIQEVLAKDASAGQWIKDFVNSDNPKFAGKSKEQRKKQALAAYYAKQRNEEVESVEEGVVDTVKKVAKKVGEVLGGPDDEGHRKDLQRKMGAKPQQQHGKKSMGSYNEESELGESLYSPRATNVLARHRALHAQSTTETDPTKKAELSAKSSKAHKTFLKVRDRDIAKDPEGHARKMQSGATQDFKDQEARRGIGHVRDHVEVEGQVVEGWDDMVKAAKDSVKSGPKPSGGSGVKQGTRYGGGKQTSKPEQDEDDKKKVNEGKRPEDDSVPFAPPYSTSPSEVVDKSGAKHTPMSRAHHLARLAMKKVKSDLAGGKKGK